MFSGKPKLFDFPQRGVAVRFALIFAAMLGISAAVAAALYLVEVRLQTAALRNSQRQHVDAQADFVAADLKLVASDLMILAEGKTLAALLADRTSDSRSNLAEEFRLVAQQKRLYDQLRFLDDQGQEAVRVNFQGGEPLIVAENNLQSKRDRYYFQQTSQLGKGEIYISPFDLNVENGQIEQPSKPTIRLATPVFDSLGQRRGMVIINYLGTNLLKQLERAAANQPGHIMLLNSDGFWLLGPEPQKQWAFMYSNRQELSFAAEFPKAWAQLCIADRGQFRSRGGQFTFSTVYPARQLRDRSATRPPVAGGAAAADSDYAWKLVSYIPPDRMAAQTRPALANILWLLGAVTLLLGGVSWFLARSLVAQREARQRLIEQQRLAAIGAAMTALSHESRNALQRSQSGLEMLARRLGDNPQLHELLAEIQDAQYHLRDLYEEVRDWAVPVQPRPEEVDLRQLAQSVWQQLQQQRTSPGDAFQLRGEADTICHVDRRMMGQVLRNLFENALAAAAPAEVTVEFQDAAPPGTLRLIIADWGPGLDDEQRLRLFEPFYTTKTHGTGLGMAISRRLVEAHGGRIFLAESESEGNRAAGARVVIELPRRSL